MILLLISSSPRKEKSNTYLLAKEVIEGVGKDVTKTEVIHLCNYEIKFCRHCERCHKKILDCPIDDDALMIIEKMLEADGIILATPNYINQITASMKSLFERASHFIHCKRLLGKFVVGVVTSGSGNDSDVLNYIKYYSHICGAQYSGSISSRALEIKDKIKEAQKLGKQFALDIKSKRVFPEQMEIINKFKEYFKQIIQIRKVEWKGEYEYWLEKGWL